MAVKYIRSEPHQFCRQQQYGEGAIDNRLIGHPALDARRYSRAVRPRDNENAANTMRVTAIVRIRFSHVDVSQNGWDKDEKADTSETIITERGRSARRVEKREEKKRRNRRNDDKAKGRVERARMIYVHEAIGCIIYRSIEGACAVARRTRIMHARLPNSNTECPTSCAIDHCPPRSMTLMRLIGT
ncbi:hypothetical protein K0M31_011260 [Melipona bicolor]|uniref:Uncharacterized protein n=1 Tax=Melipona bicolor TaxID=60889 RepID=A0AA40G979_9HYME|nr:hypothetical protein K0M31_011260 [Melipona bicolor]